MMLYITIDTSSHSVLDRVVIQILWSLLFKLQVYGICVDQCSWMWNTLSRNSDNTTRWILLFQHFVKALHRSQEISSSYKVVHSFLNYILIAIIYCIINTNFCGWHCFAYDLAYASEPNLHMNTKNTWNSNTLLYSHYFLRVYFVKLRVWSIIEQVLLMAQAEILTASNFIDCDPHQRHWVPLYWGEFNTYWEMPISKYLLLGLN